MMTHNPSSGTKHQRMSWTYRQRTVPAWPWLLRCFSIPLFCPPEEPGNLVKSQVRVVILVNVFVFRWIMMILRAHSAVNTASHIWSCCAIDVIKVGTRPASNPFCSIFPRVNGFVLHVSMWVPKSQLPNNDKLWHIEAVPSEDNIFDLLR